ncbi:hypothetical protein KNV00_gp074 [Streptomyces phage Bmoc]|uniref:Uncharacterized protein n=1 Tax=Streptomyces phage Bmoc TaxID=2725629 RepID=A0A6M3SY76_9CAUD|nr:hypothetical protein KNV00_gp074 [Streptomyces phage Bmoc]QJD50945.1 hypothetical protein SEA_BMOC_236 [Streptomyces phage Bmoc]
MDSEQMYLVGDIVEIFFSSSGNRKWVGLKAEVLPWPENEEQYEDGELHNWLKPLSDRPDGLERIEFMWSTRNLRKVG